ncbi:MAG: hypothetical protein HOV80_25475 [Polyangiaceae bacterium]|nr:hypothetical protein [Polyangiaceae bacterium]
MVRYLYAFGLVALTACGSASAPSQGALASGEQAFEPAPAAKTAAAPSAKPDVATPQGVDAASPSGERLGLWPAGTCGFDPYLSGACDTFEAPRFAVVLSEHAKHQIPSRKFRRMSDDAASSLGPSRALFGDLPVRPQDELARAERALEAARSLGLAAGYPFAVSYDDLPARDEKKRGVAIVAGLFATKAEADELVASKHLAAQVVELAPALAAQMDCSDDYEACTATQITVVEMLAPTKAYSTATIEKLIEEQNELPWVKYDKAALRERKALERLPSACEVKAGQLFLAKGNRLYRQMRKYAPVTCPSGAEAWVPWRATRLESAVLRKGNEASLHQVILVECDVPTLEERPFLPTVPEKVAVDMAGCPG